MKLNWRSFVWKIEKENVSRMCSLKRKGKEKGLGGIEVASGHGLFITFF